MPIRSVCKASSRLRPTPKNGIGFLGWNLFAWTRNGLFFPQIIDHLFLHFRHRGTNRAPFDLPEAESELVAASTPNMPASSSHVLHREYTAMITVLALLRFSFRWLPLSLPWHYHPGTSLLHP